MNAMLMQVRVRFNAEEAIEELLRLNLISDVKAEGDGAQHYAAVLPPGEASQHLNLHWRQVLLQRIDSRIQHIA